VITPDGVAIGTLCVFDLEPRTIDAHQRAALQTLADRIVDVLELDRRSRQLAATLERMHRVQRELERSNQQLAAFAGQVSHDLRNPLTAVGMALNLLREELDDLDGTQPGGQATWLASRALSATNRMKELVDELLDYARVGGDLRRTDVALDQVVADVLADLSAPLAGARVEVGELPVVHADRTQVRALLQNLVANAAKFVHPGDQPAIEVSATRLDGGWRVEVADRGIGVAATERDRVFEPLARVDSAIEGSGIGLATCKRIVEAHGGAIGMEGREGGGTVVWFELPDPPA
jgi:signal transduction histidine kinase